MTYDEWSAIVRSAHAVIIIQKGPPARATAYIRGREYFPRLDDGTPIPLDFTRVRWAMDFGFHIYDHDTGKRLQSPWEIARLFDPRMY